jgi:hypothetical protein
MFWEFVSFWLWLGISLIVHEFGHVMVADKLGYGTRIRFFKRVNGKKRYGVHSIVSPWPKPRHDLKILIGGLVSGLVFVSMYVFSHPSVIVGLTMLFVYLFFTRDDLKQVFFINKINTGGLTK